MINEPATLVILSPGFPENEADTTCLPAQQVFVRALNKAFPQLDIIILAFNYPFARGSYQWHGNTVIAFGNRDRGGRIRLLSWLRAWRKLRQLKKRRRLSGLFSWWCTECALLGKWFGKRYGIPHYCWILGQDAREGNRYVKWIRPAAGELVAMSEFLAAEFHRNYDVKPAHIIPNGVDPGLYDPVAPEKDLELFGAGSLIPLKNYELFVRVVHRLKEHFPAIRAALSGAGPEENKLRGLIDRYGLGDNLLLTGKKEHREVLHSMERAKIFLHPSSYEGFSTVCLEALYAGAHVISLWNPMAGWIRHWHIVRDEEEMVQEALDILQDPQTGYDPVLAYRMEDSARNAMRLFGYTGP
jgi:glycosyltransferase involved in cell wall biosynthesis